MKVADLRSIETPELNKKVEEFKKWAADNGYQIIRIDKAEGFEAWC